MSGIAAFFSSAMDMLIGVKPVEGWVLWVVFGFFALCLILVGVLLFFAMRRKHRPAEARPVPGAQVFEGGNLGMPSQFAHADRALRKLVGVAGWRYKSPWFLLLGESASGKSSLMSTLAAAGIGGEQGSTADECRFWFFERGIILDPVGRLILNKDGTRPSSSGWNQFLHLLQVYRPKRPMDGIIVTLSCEDLLDRSPKGGELLRRKAMVLREHLSEAQRQLGIRPAVWVMLTKADRIAGFVEFASALPPALRDTMLGWSSHYNPDTPFSTEWVNEATEGLKHAVEDALLELLAARTDFPGAGAALQFAGEVDRLRETLAEILNELFRASAYQEAVMPRGVYLTGSTRAAPASMGLRALPDDAANDQGRSTTDQGRSTAATAVAFVKDAFANKIFPEFGLSQPVGRLILSANRRVRAAQLAVVALTVVLAVGLLVSTPRLTRDAQIARNIVETTTRDLTQLARRDTLAASVVDTTYRDATTGILGAISGLHENSLYYAFFPSSWGSGLQGEFKQAVLVAYNKIIIDGIARRLSEVAQQLADRGAPAPAQDTAGIVDPAIDELPEFVALANYLERVWDLDMNVRLYQSIPRDPDVETIDKLVSYLYKIELPPAFRSGQKLFEEPLRAVTLPPFEFARYAAGMNQRLEGLATQLAENIHNRNSVTGHARDLARLMAALARAGGTGRVDLGTLASLRDAIVHTEAALESPNNAWLRREQFEIPTGLERLLDNIGQSRFFTPAIAQAIRERLMTNHVKARQDLFRIQVERYGPVLVQPVPNGPIQLSQRVTNLRTDLDSLLNAEFVKAQGTGRLRLPVVLPANGRVKWNAAQLERAVDLYFQYVDYIQNRGGRDGTGARAERQPVFAAGAEQLLANMMDHVAQALTVEPVGGAVRGRTPESVIATEAANLGEVSMFLAELIQAYGELGAYDSEIELSRLVEGQATRLMRQIDGLLVEEQLYGGGNPDFSWWDGTDPPAMRFFGTTDRVELGQYLGLQRERLTILVRNYARPVMSFLLSQRGMASQIDLPILSKWQRLQIQLERHEKKVPASSVGQLEQFVTGPMARMTRENCQQLLAPRPKEDDSADYFLIVRDRLESALRSRCRTFMAVAGNEGIRSLNDRYRTQLSTRFPFAAAPPRRPSDEIRPDEVDGFFRLFDDMVNQGAGDPLNLARFGQQAPAMRNFVDSLDKVRVFLAAGRDQAPGAARLAYAVEVDFRMEREREVHGNHVIDWTLTIGDKTVSQRDTDRVLPWRFGDPVMIRLRWAKNAPTRPRKDADASPFLEIGDGVATFRYETGWSLLALLRDRQDIGETTAGPRADTARTLLLPVPVALAEDETKLAAPPYAKLFVKLRLMTPAATQRRVLTVPDFVISPPTVAMNPQ